MKLIIAGSRTLSPSPKKLHGCVGDTFVWLDTLMAGEAYVLWAKAQGFAGSFMLTRFPAEWDKQGKAAGHIRNGLMASYADVALLIWDGSSSGTANMAMQMLALDKPVRVITLDPH